ncbi:MAG: DUF1499 domain-containing protein [Oleibacter sp.]|nr:DUF1499 domain-containing protein [Thalassolituus sp.]
MTGCSIGSVAKGVSDQKLANCPVTPNCISSQDDGMHNYAAFEFEGSPAKAKKMLVEVLNAYPRCEIRENDGNYIQATFITAVFRFRDDAEFLIKDDAIEVRSASRLGLSDLGKNSRRMNEIKASFEQAMSNSVDAK